MFNRVVAYATDFADWAVNNVSVQLLYTIQLL